MTSKTYGQSTLPNFGAPTSPQTTRTLRKYQSHQTLSSSSHQRQLLRSAAGLRDASGEAAQPLPSHGRTRSNSDVSARNTPSNAPGSRRPTLARKSGSLFGRRSNLENLLREGPQNGNVLDGLQELRYLVLSTRVEADSDGMSSLRIYLWLALLNIPPLSTDEYLSLVHRGRSPAYAKIRNDTFRTLATDPLFKRRVTEASLIRLLNAVAWKLHLSKTEAPAEPQVADDLDNAESVADSVVPGPTSSAGGAADSAIYVQGMNVLCAPFLYAARSEVEGHALFHYFITKECPGYIRGAMDGVHKGLKLVDRCLEVVEPKLAGHLASKGMHAELYAFPSVLTLCACTPPLPEVLHLWDFLFAYGPHLNILCIVAQLIQMRDTLIASPNPNKVLRSFPPLDAKEIIALAVLIVRNIPDDLYQEIVDHAK